MGERLRIWLIGGVGSVLDQGRLRAGRSRHDIELMREWITASYRKHSISWSQDIRQALGLGKEKTDEELASEDPSGETVAEIDRPLWSLLAKRRDGAPAQLIAAFENDDNRRGLLAAVESVTVPHPEPPAAEFDSEISFTEMTVKDWAINGN